MVEVKNETADEVMEKRKQADTAEDTTKETPSEDVAKEKEEPQGDEAEKAETSTEEASAKESSDKKKGIKKKPKKDKRDEKIEELNDRLMRNLAEFENFRNRSEKEKSTMFEIGAKSVIEKILPIVDNLERGFEGLSDEEKETPFAKGIEAVYKQLMTSFEELRVTSIEAVGQEFDPNFHNAVMHDEDDSEQTNVVVEEFQKGYMYKDTVVRHSMVKVLN